MLQLPSILIVVYKELSQHIPASRTLNAREPHMTRHPQFADPWYLASTLLCAASQGCFEILTTYIIDSCKYRITLCFEICQENALTENRWPVMIVLSVLKIFTCNTRVLNSRIVPHVCVFYCCLTYSQSQKETYQRCLRGGGVY